MDGTEPTDNGPDLELGIELSRLTEGAIVKGHVQGEPVLLVRSAGELRAVGGKCTHYGAPLADGLVVVGTNSGRVYAMDGDTGALRWARRLRGEIASSPAIDGERVIVSSMGGLLRAYGVNGGTVRWTYDTGSPIESSPLVVGGIVYVGAWNGTLSAIDVATGRTRWTYHAPGEIKGSVTLRKRAQRPAPSNSAASYNSCGTPCRPARKINMVLPPIAPHIAMMIKPAIAHCGSRNQPGGFSMLR